MQIHMKVLWIHLKHNQEKVTVDCVIWAQGKVEAPSDVYHMPNTLLNATMYPSDSPRKQGEVTVITGILQMRKLRVREIP